jgi:hypothetical protein
MAFFREYVSDLSARLPSGCAATVGIANSAITPAMVIRNISPMVASEKQKPRPAPRYVFVAFSRRLVRVGIG